MNTADRGKIINNIPQLVGATEYDKMKEACLRKEVLFDPMVEKIEASFFLISQIHEIHLQTPIPETNF